MALARLRVLDRAYLEILAQDPECGLTKTALRRLAISGDVRTVMVGRKRLIDMDDLERYLSGEITVTLEDVPQSAGIRRIDLR